MFEIARLKRIFLKGKEKKEWVETVEQSLTVGSHLVRNWVYYRWHISSFDAGVLYQSACIEYDGTAHSFGTTGSSILITPYSQNEIEELVIINSLKNFCYFILHNNNIE